MKNVWATFIGIALAGGFANTVAATPQSDEATIDEVTVTSQRRAQTTLELTGNVALLPSTLLASVAHQHPHEILSRVAGTWISRGSGQEHLTAIRSPVLTGAGSCGGFLFLEDGIPIRPSGFCNVNQLFELNTEQAERIEVVRGPGSAVYGSNALHGIVNVLMPQHPGATTAAVEAGSNEFFRARSVIDLQPVLASFVYTDDGGFRDDSGYRQGKLHARSHWDFPTAELTVAVSLTGLSQETAGFITGRDAYRDPAVNRSNPNPEAFRDARSQRLYAIWRKTVSDVQFDLRPYLRHTDMKFLQHFLPGQPLEENGHKSVGFLSSMTLTKPGFVWQNGLDVDWSDVFLQQQQFGPTTGSDFLRETRPAGKHYDYDVRAWSAAPWTQIEFDVDKRWAVSAGLRAEYLHYDYRNKMLNGNTRDDGTACGFGGCLYTRPADRQDDFVNLAPKLGVRFALDADTTLFASAARGFRAPQTTELYRLQSGQSVADLDSERVDALEVGIRFVHDTVRGEFSAFAMRKRGSVLRDAEGFNVSGGRSRHRGIEATLDWQLTDILGLRLNTSYARHLYDFDLVAARGETFVKGADIDTAPRWLGSAEFYLEAADDASLAIQWTLLGEYFLDAENRFSYPGHELVNLRGRIDLNDSFTVTARLNNAFNETIADRADYAFGNYRYFPGRGRELFIELRYTQ